MKFFLTLLLLNTTVAFSQSADFIILKKRGKTIETFYAGTHITFTSTTGAYRDALINRIQNDSIYLQEFITQYQPTTFGTYIIDTLGSYRYQYHYNQIAVIGRKEKRGFNTKGSGAALLGGGVVLTLASGVVYLVDRQKFSAPLLIASVALGTIGYFLAKGGKSGMIIGKKYKLVYMSMSHGK